MLLIEYERCSTCKKAKQWLIDNKYQFETNDIKEQTPNKQQLKHWAEKFNIPINKFFNTSGISYRRLNLKNKLSTLSYEEKLELLASDGMLIKRPLLITDTKMLIGFKIDEWEALK